MGAEPPPKYVNRELNSQIGLRSQDSHFSKSDGVPLHPCSCGVLHTVSDMKNVMQMTVYAHMCLLLPLSAALPHLTVRARQSQAPHN